MLNTIKDIIAIIVAGTIIISTAAGFLLLYCLPYIAVTIAVIYTLRFLGVL